MNIDDWIISKSNLTYTNQSNLFSSRTLVSSHHQDSFTPSKMRSTRSKTSNNSTLDIPSTHTCSSNISHQHGQLSNNNYHQVSDWLKMKFAWFKFRCDDQTFRNISMIDGHFHYKKMSRVSTNIMFTYSLILSMFVQRIGDCSDALARYLSVDKQSNCTGWLESKVSIEKTQWSDPSHIEQVSSDCVSF